MYLNHKELSLCNAIQWHEAGYKGKGIKIAVKDLSGINPNLPIFEGKVSDPFQENEIGYNTHVQHVVSVIREVSPEAEIFILGSSWPANLKYCIENEIDLVNVSTTESYDYGPWNELEAEAIEKGTFFVCAAGNDGKEGLRGFSNKDTWLSVAATHMQKWNNDKIVRASYSSYDQKIEGNHLDVTGFSALTVPHTTQGKTTVTGTSFASPWVVGLLALYRQWFKETYKRKPAFDETMEHVTLNTLDLESPGFDFYTGHGLFSLPEVPKEREKIEMFIGKDKGLKNGQEVALYISPIIQNARTLVGLRDIGELFGFKVTWDGTQEKITIEK
jgi:hypothetical protein